MAAIALERTRLLRGIRPGQGLPPACKSVYLPHTMIADDEWDTGRAWATLIECYRHDAFVPDRNLPPDYVGNELGFLAHLSAREASAWERDDARDALAAAASQLIFMRTHIGSWIGALVDRVGDEVATAFGPACSRLSQHTCARKTNT